MRGEDERCAGSSELISKMNRFTTITVDDSLSTYLSLVASNAQANIVDSIPAITYNPSSTWSSIAQSAGGSTSGGPEVSPEQTVVSAGFYYNNSVSFTQTAGDSVTFKFQGECIDTMRRRTVTYQPKHRQVPRSVSMVLSDQITDRWTFL